MPARVLLVRHGQTEWSADGRHTGLTDVPLTDEGRAMARALGARLRAAPWEGLPGARVLTSPLGRARETCRLAGFGDRARDCPDLVEWDYGAYEGRSSREIRAGGCPGWVIWRDGVPAGETLAEVGRRADRFLGLLGLPRPGGGAGREGDVGAGDMGGDVGDVLVFAHGHLLRVLAARWLGLPPAYGRCFRLGPAALSVLTWEHGDPVVGLWNDVGHLAPGGGGAASGRGRPGDVAGTGNGASDHSRPCAE